MAIRSTLLAATALVGAAVAAGCYTGSAVDTNRSPSSEPTTSTDGTQPVLKAGSNVHGLTHLPCDVEQMLSDACWQCHGTVPGYGAATTLVTYDDISKVTPIGMHEADIMLIRMQATENTMPPDNPPTAAQIATLQNWITAGYPQGTCGESDGGAEGGTTTTTGDDDDDSTTVDPSQVPSVCTSGVTIPSTTTGSKMNPGKACLGCHDANATTTLTLGGTVYPTLNEPDMCEGTQASVVIIDANGTAHTFTTNDSGNFYSETNIPAPYKAMVVKGTTTKTMQTPISNGDCNSCHSASPQEGQPGRIVAPAGN